MKPLATALPDRRVWLRVASPDWVNPLDPGWAGIHGGRWNPPKAFPTLYLNANVQTALLQIERLCEGMPFTPEDLSDDATYSSWHDYHPVSALPMRSARKALAP